jgi:SAM-dependent methyltransferase
VEGTLVLTQAPADDWIAEHRRVWARKGGLRAVYERWFDDLRAACMPAAPVVELGCGAGLFKQRYPEVLATDAGENPFADRIVDASALPFGDATVGTFVMLDVFHHLPQPAIFLAEAARALVPGGRVAMIEPWVGLAGHLLYRYVHHETCDLRVDPAQPWQGAGKDPMEGNVALPYLYFRPGGHLERLSLPLRIVRRTRFAALPWLLSGGFQSFSLLPAACAAAAQACDRALSAVPALTASRCAVVLERTP